MKFTLVGFFAIGANAVCRKANLQLSWSSSIKQQETKFLGDCEKLCQQEVSCFYASWDRATHQCKMMGEDANITAVSRIGHFVSPKKCCDTKVCSHQLQYIYLPAMSAGECATACQADETCETQVYFPETSKCFHKVTRRMTGTSGERNCETDIMLPHRGIGVHQGISFVSKTEATATNVRDCAKNCEADDKCKYFTFNAEKKSCHVGNELEELVDCESCLSGSVDDCYEFGVASDSPSLDILNGVPSAKDCMGECLARSCVGITYNITTGTCDLKKDTFTTIETGLESDISAPAVCCDVTGMKYGGDDLSKSKAKNVYECRSLCLADEKCMNFSFNVKAGECALSGAKAKAEPKQADFISGPRACWVEENMRWLNEEIKTVDTDTKEKCQIACGEEEGCYGWSYTGKKCRLAGGAGLGSDSIGTTSGFMNL